MKWNKKQSECKRERVVTVFLFFPRCISNTWRWLEMAKVRQVRRFFETSDGLGISRTYYWKWVQWLD